MAEKDQREQHEEIDLSPEEEVALDTTWAKIDEEGFAPGPDILELFDEEVKKPISAPKQDKTDKHQGPSK